MVRVKTLTSASAASLARACATQSSAGLPSMVSLFAARSAPPGSASCSARTTRAPVSAAASAAASPAGPAPTTKTSQCA